MKKLFILLIALLATSMMSNAQARDTRHLFPLADALNNENAKEKLDGSVQFYFGNSGHPAVIKNYGEFMSNKKTNAFNKTDKYACEWAFLSAMLSFQERAKQLGGNAIINITSYYKKNTINSNSTEYECGAGGVIAGVTFKGVVVNIGGGGTTASSSVQSNTNDSNNGNVQQGNGQANQTQTAQKLLTILGFDPGPADGKMGNKTENAITQYQKQQGIPSTGALDSETLARMGIQ